METVSSKRDGVLTANYDLVWVQATSHFRKRPISVGRKSIFSVKVPLECLMEWEAGWVRLGVNWGIYSIGADDKRSCRARGTGFYSTCVEKCCDKEQKNSNVHGMRRKSRREILKRKQHKSATTECTVIARRDTRPRSTGCKRIGM